MTVPRLSLVDRLRPIQTPKKKKRRSQWYFYARANLEKIIDDGLSAKHTHLMKYETFSGLENCFQNWRNEYTRKYCALYRQEDNDLLFIRMVSRFDEEYRSKLRKKLRKLNNFKFDVKIEFTLDPKMFLRLNDLYTYINKRFNRWRTWFNKKYGGSLKRFEYLKVLEFQKTGRPHLHVLFGSNDPDVSSYFCETISKNPDEFNAFYSDVKDKWDSGHIWVKPVTNRNRLNVTGYVLKYVNKTLKAQNKRYSALLFASNLRLFSLSRGLQWFVRSRQRDPQGYKYIGSMKYHDLYEYIQLKGHIEMQDYLHIEFDVSDLSLSKSLNYLFTREDDDYG